MKRLFVLVALLAALPLTGCVATSDYMTRSTAASPTPAPDKALVVFMRPSNYGGGIQASVYDATGPV